MRRVHRLNLNRKKRGLSYFLWAFPDNTPHRKQVIILLNHQPFNVIFYRSLPCTVYRITVRTYERALKVLATKLAISKCLLCVCFFYTIKFFKGKENILGYTEIRHN